jgi:hypothetical protein
MDGEGASKMKGRGRSDPAWDRAVAGGVIPAGDLAVLNGFAANETPPAGQRIKIVIAGQ